MKRSLYNIAALLCFNFAVLQRKRGQICSG